MSLFKSIAILVSVLSINTAFAAESKMAATKAAPAASVVTVEEVEANLAKYQQLGKDNKTVRVEGTVQDAFCDAKRCFINFNKDYQTHLTAVFEGVEIAPVTHSSDPKANMAALKAKIGTKIRVTGLVGEFKGRPQITVKGETFEVVK